MFMPDSVAKTYFNTRTDLGKLLRTSIMNRIYAAAIQHDLYRFLLEDH